jgi:hypothetical protein
MQRRFAAVAGLLLFGLAALGQAAPTEKLPQDLTMVMVLDMAGLRSSELYRKHAAELMAQWEQNQEEDYLQFKQATGFDLARDLNTLTLGLGGDMTAPQPKLYAVVDGNFDRAKFDAYFKGKGDKFTVGEHSGLTTYTGKPEEGKTDQPPTIAFLDASTLIVASAPEFAAMAAAARGTGNLQASSPLGQLVSQAPKGQLQMVMVLPEQAKQQLQGNPQAASLANVQTVELAVNATSGVDVVLQAGADTADNAKGVYDTLNGFLAMGRMMSAQNPQLQAAMTGLKLEQDGTKNRVALAFTAEQVEGLIAQARAGAAGGDGDDSYDEDDSGDDED